MTPASCDRVLLVGFMGSGKSTVGRALARRLGWRFIDFDDAIVGEEGTSVAEIFERRGERYFRDLEARVADRLLSENSVVLGSGGGWASAPGRIREVPAGTESFWLRVSPQVAVERASRQPGVRPLLAGADPLGEATRLVAERAPFYSEARWTVDTEHSAVEDVAARILEILQREYPDIRTK